MSRAVALLIDSSASMSRRSVVEGREMIRRDWALEQAGMVVSGLGAGDRVAVTDFAEEVGPLVFRDQVGAGRSLQDCRDRSDAGGSTALYDCALTAAESLSEHQAVAEAEECLLVVITDGQDVDSHRCHSLEELERRVADLAGNVQLRIVPLPGTSIAPTVPDGTTPPAAPQGTHIRIDTDVEAVLGDLARPVVPRADISFPVLNLDAQVTADDLAGIAEQYRRVVPYLETLTGLRYYPVPTVVVPESSVTKMGQQPVERPKLPWEVLAALELLNTMCIPYHKSARQAPSGSDEEDEFRRAVRGFAECPGGPIREWIESGRLQEPLSYLVKKHARWRGEPHGLLVVLREAFRMVESALATEIERGAQRVSTWGVFTELGPDNLAELLEAIGVDPALAAAWSWKSSEMPDRPYLSVEASVGHQTLVALTEWLLDWMGHCSWALLDESDAAETADDWRFQEVRMHVRRYGFYRAASPHCLPAEPPVDALSATSGVVVVCAQPVLEKIGTKPSNKSFGSSAPPAFTQADAAGIFGSILVHEHFHAILNEGLPSPPSRRSGRAQALEEALAEWVELDLFRHDKQMRDWVLAHAASGIFPSWPYAGAILVERLAQEDGREGVTKLIEEFRADPDGTHDQFITRFGLREE